MDFWYFPGLLTLAFVLAQLWLRKSGPALEAQTKSSLVEAYWQAILGPGRADKWLIKHAKNASAEQLAWISHCFFSGHLGVRRNRKLARKLGRDAHHKGAELVAFDLANRAFEDRDPEAAFDWYQKARERRLNAAFNVSVMMLNGNGTAKDANRALMGLSEAFDSKDSAAAGAALFLAEGYSQADCSFYDPQKSDFWRHKAWVAAAARIGKAWYHLGMLYCGMRFSTSDYVNAARCFEKGYKEGDTWCGRELARLLEKGDGLEQNAKRAIEIYQAVGMAENAARLLTLSDDPDHHVEAFNLLKGSTPPAGASHAHEAWANLYAHGLGVPQDLAKAHYHLVIARKTQFKGHERQLAQNLTTGTGVIKNLSAAYAWYTLGYIRGDRQAFNARKKLEKQMSRSQITEGRELAWDELTVTKDPWKSSKNRYPLFEQSGWRSPFDDHTPPRDEPKAPVRKGPQVLLKWLESRPLALSDYRALMADYDPPEDEQIKRFIEVIYQCKSIMSNPQALPGRPGFHFYTPTAGMNVTRMGRLQESNIPCSDIPRARITGNKQRYGCLTYSEAYHQQYEYPELFTEDGCVYQLPDEIIRAGRVVHLPCINEKFDHRLANYWQRYLSGNSVTLPELYVVPEGASWPEETGGRAVLERIVEVINEEKTKPPDERAAWRQWLNDEIRAAILPERQRQQNAVLEAYFIVRELVW